RNFGLESEPGLAEVLGKGIDPAGIIKPASNPNLFLLPRGAITHNSSELFLRESIDEFLKSIATQYDYVLLDSPPVMAADDVCCLAPHVDGVLFLIRAEHT